MSIWPSEKWRLCAALALTVSAWAAAPVRGRTDYPLLFDRELRLKRWVTRL